MIKKSIEEFKQKHPNFNLEQFIEDYLSGLSRERLCENHNLSEMPLRMFMQSLGLAFPKSRRHSSYECFKYALGLEDNIADVKLVKELEEDIDKLSEKNRKLYASLTLARDEANNLRKESRQEARQGDLYERIYEEFLKHLSSLDKVETIIKISTPCNLPRLQDGLVLILGDSHWGDVSKQEECGNNYNFEVASSRLDFMVDKTLSNPYQSHNLVVVELLDILKGLLHNSEYLSEGGITGSMLKVVEMYSATYVKLAPHYNKIKVVVTNSNHDRTTQWTSSHMKYDNFGILLYKMVEMLIKAKGVSNVEFEYTMKEHHLITINNAKIFITHGDAIRTYKASSMAERAKTQAICLGMFKEPYKHMISGHLHQSVAVSNEYGGYNIVNGTMVGNSTYGVSNGFASIEPIQTILFLNLEGNIEQIAFVNLRHIQ